MAKSWASFAAAVLLVASPVRATTVLTADADARGWAVGPDRRVGLAAVAAGVRHVFADSKGDRLTVFGLLESVHDFDRTQFDQAYVKYKGPLGKWNLTAGRYIVPFGLLTSYSSKRLLAPTVESRTVGVESDNGVSLSGFVGGYEYAASFSEGVGMGKWWDEEARGLLIVRAGWEGVDFETPKPGLSLAYGESVWDVHGHVMGERVLRRMAALDVTWNRGAGVMRAELSGGKQDDTGSYGVFAAADYSLSSRLELNAAWVQHRGAHGKGGGVYAGATVNVIGLKTRASYKLATVEEEEDELVFQLYWYFSHTR